RPDGADRLFLVVALGDGRARAVGVVPSLGVAGRAQGPAAGHLEVAGGVGLADPGPGVAEPVVGIALGLVRVPGGLVVAPGPDAAGLRLAGGPAGAPVVDLDEVRQVLARPAARRDPAPAPAVEAVGEADLEDRLLRPVGDLLDPERERVEVHQQRPVAD